MADWEKIRTEYVTTPTSYRKLAEKYGLRYRAVAERGRAEGWSQLRCGGGEEDTQGRDKASRLQTVADKLLNKLEAYVDGCDPADLDTKSLRQISATLKDIMHIQMIRAEGDLREQEARIAKLQRQAEKGILPGQLTVMLEGGLEDYAE